MHKKMTDRNYKDWQLEDFVRYEPEEEEIKKCLEGNPLPFKKVPLTQGDVEVLKRWVDYKNGARDRQEKWKTEFEEEWIECATAAENAISRMRKIMPPYIRDGEAGLYGDIDSILHHLAHSYDDQDVWNSSAIC